MLTDSKVQSNNFNKDPSSHQIMDIPADIKVDEMLKNEVMPTAPEIQVKNLCKDSSSLAITDILGDTESFTTVPEVKLNNLNQNNVVLLTNGSATENTVIGNVF